MDTYERKLKGEDAVFDRKDAHKHIREFKIYDATAKKTSQILHI